MARPVHSEESTERAIVAGVTSSTVTTCCGIFYVLFRPCLDGQ